MPFKEKRGKRHLSNVVLPTEKFQTDIEKLRNVWSGCESLAGPKKSANGNYHAAKHGA